MTYFSIRFARLAALSILLMTAGCTINTYSRDSTSGDEAEPEKDKPKKDKPEKDKPKKDKPKKPAEDDKEAKPEKPKPEKEKDPKPKPEKEKDPKPKPDEEKPASKPEKPKDEPVVEKPKDDKPKDDKPKDDKPAPQPERSKIVLPITVALEALEKEIDSLIPQTDKKDWAQITKDNNSPKAELKYELWRDPIKLSLDGHTFRIVVPVRYAATVRAQMKNPLTKDWFWIAKSETWGTKAEPQRLTAHFDATVRVADDWRVKSDLKLVKLEHGDSPSGDICKNVGIKVCVAKSSIAGEVREGIDKQLEPKLRKALDKVSSRVERAFDVKKRAEKVWSAVQKPQALPGTLVPAWLVVRPTAVAVGRPEKKGSNVVIDLAVEGRLSVEPGKKPKVEAKPLPKISEVKGSRGFHVRTELRIPRAALGRALENEIKGIYIQGKNKPLLAIGRPEVTAHVDAKNQRRLTLKVAFGPDTADVLELQGELVYDAERQRLGFEKIEVASSSRGVVSDRLAGYDVREIEKALAKKAYWNLSEEAAPLKKMIVAAIESSLRGHATVSGELKELDVPKLELTAEAIEADVVIGGSLEVEVGR